MLKLKAILFSLFLVTLVGCGRTQATTNETTGKSSSGEIEAAQTQEKSSFKPFNVYTDKGAGDNHFIPSGWMGDFRDISFSDASLENPHSAESCIRVAYSNKASQGARWAGIYWQNPANNWGTKKGGFDLTGATYLKFWARGENGGERIEEFKIGGITGEFPDSDIASIGPVILTKDWKEYTIDLRGKDLSYISGGFCWATNIDVNPNGATFYIDDIVFE